MEFAYLPARIAALPRDDRGYPIPYIVLRDLDDKPQFAANDMRLVRDAVADDLCHVCGQELDAWVWFLGGVGSAFLNGDAGQYADGPMHQECMRFAVQYCPHIAGKMTKALAPSLVPRLREQAKVISPTARVVLAAQDTTSIPGVPSLFVAVAVARDRWGYDGGMHFSAPKPYHKIEYWRKGGMVPLQEGRKLAKRLARELAAQLVNREGDYLQ